MPFFSRGAIRIVSPWRLLHSFRSSFHSPCSCLHHHEHLLLLTGFKVRRRLAIRQGIDQCDLILVGFDQPFRNRADFRRLGADHRDVPWVLLRLKRIGDRKHFLSVLIVGDDGLVVDIDRRVGQLPLIDRRAVALSADDSIFARQIGFRLIRGATGAGRRDEEEECNGKPGLEFYIFHVLLSSLFFNTFYVAIEFRLRINRKNDPFTIHRSIYSKGGFLGLENAATYGFQSPVFSNPRPSGHFSSPGAGLLTAGLDEILESLQISFHSAGNHTYRVAGLLHRSLGLIFQPKVEF